MTQLNGMATPAIRASKIAQSTALINKYEVDIQSYVEHGLNMAQLKPSKTFDSFFEAEVEMRLVTGHNRNEDPKSAHQQGDTGLLATNEICQYLVGRGTDFRGLGRWSWMTLGSSIHQTRVLSVYCVGKRIADGLGQGVPTAPSAHPDPLSEDSVVSTLQAGPCLATQGMGAARGSAHHHDGCE